MNLAGYDFQFNPNVPLLVDTQMQFPLTRFGGTFGQTPTHDLSKGFLETDGIAEFNNGKSIQMVVMITRSGANGLYKFNIGLEEIGGEAEEIEL